MFVLLRKNGRHSLLIASPLKHKVVQQCKPLYVWRDRTELITYAYALGFGAEKRILSRSHC